MADEWREKIVNKLVLEEGIQYFEAYNERLDLFPSQKSLYRLSKKHRIYQAIDIYGLLRRLGRTLLSVFFITLRYWTKLSRGVKGHFVADEWCLHACNWLPILDISNARVQPRFWQGKTRGNLGCFLREWFDSSNSNLSWKPKITKGKINWLTNLDPLQILLKQAQHMWGK